MTNTDMITPAVIHFSSTLVRNRLLKVEELCMTRVTRLFSATAMLLLLLMLGDRNGTKRLFRIQWRTPTQCKILPMNARDP